MKDLERILVGVDLDDRCHSLSPGSRRAIDTALWMASQTDCQVVLVHSTGHDRYVDFQGNTCHIVHEGIPPEGEEALDATLHGFDAVGVDARLVLRPEDPWLAIGLEAQSSNADLVLVGGYVKEDEGRQMGGVSLKLVRKCPKPVWVVRPRDADAPVRVIAATDLGNVGGRAITYAAWLAKRMNAELHVVHAYQIPMGAGWVDNPVLITAPYSIESEVRQALTEQLDDCAPGVQVRSHIDCTSPKHGIMALLERLQPELLVMGTSSRSGIPGLLLGNTAEKVLPRTTCSVLVVKPEGFVSPIKA